MFHKKMFNQSMFKKLDLKTIRYIHDTSGDFDYFLNEGMLLIQFGVRGLRNVRIEIEAIKSTKGEILIDYRISDDRSRLQNTLEVYKEMIKVSEFIEGIIKKEESIRLKLEIGVYKIRNEVKEWIIIHGHI